MKWLKLSLGVLLLAYGFMNAYVAFESLVPVIGGRMSLRQLFLQSDAEVVLALAAALLIGATWLILSSLRAAKGASQNPPNSAPSSSLHIP